MAPDPQSLPRQTAIERVAIERNCIPPVPCGRGAGPGGADLECDCEAIASSPLIFRGPTDNTISVTLSAGEELMIDPDSGDIFNSAGTHIGTLERFPKAFDVAS